MQYQRPYRADRSNSRLERADVVLYYASSSATLHQAHEDDTASKAMFVSRPLIELNSIVATHLKGYNSTRYWTGGGNTMLDGRHLV
jgi:Ethanolamine utilization protein EutJ (predicted chaperonin)